MQPSDTSISGLGEKFDEITFKAMPYAMSAGIGSLCAIYLTGALSTVLDVKFPNIVQDGIGVIGATGGLVSCYKIAIADILYRKYKNITNK